MPIRFHCQRCQQLLGIASRKAGSEIQCPKCGVSQIVPGEEAAAAAMALGQFSKAQAVSEDTSNLVVYEDEPAAIEAPRLPPAKREADAGTAPADSEAPPPEPVRPVPRGMILYPRCTFYVQGLLVLLLAGAAFGIGYLVGRGDAQYEFQVAKEEAGRNELPIRGKIVYDPGGRIAVDDGAVVIALPEGKFPKKKMEISGIRPQDPPVETHKTIRTITEELGGAFGRTDASGKFHLFVPGEGRYHLLIISSYVERPKNSGIDEFHLAEMEPYFTMPDRLINRFKYRWSTEEVNFGFNPIEHNFGANAEE